MQTASAGTGHIPLYLCGDMHAHAEARIMRTGPTDLSRNPPSVFLSGAISTHTGWPSRARRVLPVPSTHVVVEEKQPCLEENGFLVVDFTEAEVTIRAFRWSPRQSPEVIDTLEPFRSARLTRSA